MPINRIFKITNIFNTFKIKALFKVLYICKGLLYKYFGVLATRTEAFKSLSHKFERELTLGDINKDEERYNRRMENCVKNTNTNVNLSQQKKVIFFL